MIFLLERKLKSIFIENKNTKFGMENHLKMILEKKIIKY